MFVTIMKWLALTLIAALFLGSLALLVPLAALLFYAGQTLWRTAGNEVPGRTR